MAYQFFVGFEMSEGHLYFFFNWIINFFNLNFFMDNKFFSSSQKYQT